MDWVRDVKISACNTSSCSRLRRPAGTWRHMCAHAGRLQAAGCSLSLQLTSRAVSNVTVDPVCHYQWQLFHWIEPKPRVSLLLTLNDICQHVDLLWSWAHALVFFNFCTWTQLNHHVYPKLGAMVWTRVLFIYFINLKKYKLTKFMFLLTNIKFKIVWITNNIY